jgi:glycosyltransferase involved in cell wall biosynthesis
MEQRQRVSACVITHNRAAIVATCLRALQFADEVILVDKSSTDGTRRATRGLADRVMTVPWSPTVEDTRAYAVSLCQYPWVLLLDDDEILSPEAVRFIRGELADPRAEIYAFPLRHYVLGWHDERAYYWPEHHVRLFRRDSVAFGAIVHGGVSLLSDRVMHVPVESGACIHHLSHPDVAGWIERTNRYTGRRDRVRVETDREDDDLIAFAHARIDHWIARSRPAGGDDYPAAVAVLRAVYDIVDRLKTWEEVRGLDGAERFREVCAALEAAHEAQAGPAEGRQRMAPWRLPQVRHWLRWPDRGGRRLWATCRRLAWRLFRPVTPLRLSPPACPRPPE